MPKAGVHEVMGTMGLTDDQVAEPEAGPVHSDHRARRLHLG
jgi:hypothetical protein